MSADEPLTSDPVDLAAAWISAREERPRATRYTCPRCGAGAMRRVPLAWYLRPLRLVGISVRAYACHSCHDRRLSRTPPQAVTEAPIDESAPPVEGEDATQA